MIQVPIKVKVVDVLTAAEQEKVLAKIKLEEVMNPEAHVYLLGNPSSKEVALRMVDAEKTAALGQIARRLKCVSRWDDAGQAKRDIVKKCAHLTQDPKEAAALMMSGDAEPENFPSQLCMAAAKVEPKVRWEVAKRDDLKPEVRLEALKLAYRVQEYGRVSNVAETIMKVDAKLWSENRHVRCMLELLCSAIRKERMDDMPWRILDVKRAGNQITITLPTPDTITRAQVKKL